MVRYIVSPVGRSLRLIRRCPHCGRSHGRIHGRRRRRPISDMRVSGVLQQRLRCPWCGLTWTVRAAGVGAGRQRSDRLRTLGVILYMLGLSYRAVARFLPCLDCRGSKSSIERDVAAAGQQARSLHDAAPSMRVRVLGVDGTGAAMAGRNDGMLFYVDTEGDRLLRVEPLKETEPAKVRRHVRRVFAAVRAEELRTDEHSVYHGVVDETQHRLCLAHWRKSKGKRARDLADQADREGRTLEAEDMRRLLELLRQQPRPPTPPWEVERLVRRYSRCRKGLLWKLNQLLQHVERTWASVSNDPRDPTNNVAERQIGLTYKIRSKTMRGFKSPAKALAHPYLASLLRGRDGTSDLSNLF